MQNEFLSLIEKHNTYLKKGNIIFNFLGYAKLILVLVTGIFVYLMVTSGFRPVFCVSCAVAFALLVVLWVCHAKIHDKINYSNGIIQICNRQIDRITGKWTAFKDIGAEFTDTEHAYCCDLDIVGSKSLFQFLNTTNTWYGRQAFSNDLLRPAYSRDEIKERQNCVAELSKDKGFACDIQYHLSQIGVSASTVDLVKELTDKTPFIKNRALRLSLSYIPAITLVFIAATVIFRLQDLYFACFFIAVAQAVIWLTGITKTQNYLGAMAHLPYKLSAYVSVIDNLTSREFSSERLKQIKTQLNTASQAIKELSGIADKIDLKRNGVLFFVLNIFLLWDYECAFSLERWKNKYHHLAGLWFDAIGEFESLLCLSNLTCVCDNTCLPDITQAENVIDAKEMGHPLLPNEKRVGNDLQFNNNIFIISGSNMSGKTTFLRTLGINLVLARSGGFVCAGRMVCPIADIKTSMRISDDLNEGVSTFYAELKRIKMIIESAQSKPHIFFLIDEIFRGTNSVDRLAGAKTVLTRLNELGAAGMISTHDLELCELEELHDGSNPGAVSACCSLSPQVRFDGTNPGAVSACCPLSPQVRFENHNFSEYYKDNKIFFDYKIKPGKSNTTNAGYLMKMVGIT